jgi:hypothetical protein
VGADYRPVTARGTMPFVTGQLAKIGAAST